jgi:ubiquinone/menaquinone biosynthesis C-methylase UbiE
MADSEVVVAAFTELAPDYQPTIDRELRIFWGISYLQFLERLIAQAHIREGEIVLDVATGTACIPAQIADQVGEQGRVVGLDITPAMLQHGNVKLAAAGLLSSARLVCGSGMAMPLADGVFDVILCGLGTHHMRVPALLSEMRRVLRPGGRLVVADAAATAFWRSLVGALMLRLLVFFYVMSLRSARARAERAALDSLYTAGEWGALLAEHGFEQIEISEIHALRRYVPGGVILQAVRPAAQPWSHSTVRG